MQSPQAPELALYSESVAVPQRSPRTSIILVEATAARGQAPGGAALLRAIRAIAQVFDATPFAHIAKKRSLDIAFTACGPLLYRFDPYPAPRGVDRKRHKQAWCEMTHETRKLSHHHTNPE